MNEAKRKTILGIVLILIVGSIWYLGSLKATQNSGNSETIDLYPSTSTSQVAATSSLSSSTDNQRILKPVIKDLPRAKEISNPSGFINTDPFHLSDFVGKKVILLDFWTYSCINCIRTLPYLKAWYDKYKDEGFLIVGIHTPEFEFEKDLKNVSAATEKYGIKYPIVLDNNYGTWSAYQNLYWPSEYLIDINGYIVHHSFGEGGYAETETEIQKALKERAEEMGISADISSGIEKPTSTIQVVPEGVQSPETYFGSGRNNFLGNGTAGVSGIQNLSLPQTININTLYLAGSWNFNDQFAENLKSGAKIIYHYSAKNLYFVAGSKNGVKIKILRDGKPLGDARGGDVVSENGADVLTIKEHKLYRLIEDSKNYGDHTIEIDVEDPGLEAFTFTFG